MDNLKQKIREARDQRETGDVSKALEMFLQIDKNELDQSQLFTYLGELGLTYWHDKKFEDAKDTFEEMLSLAKKLDDKSYQAASLRQLSRPEFNEADPSKAVEQAKQARQLAFEAKREDLAWFDHGVVTTLTFSGASIDEIKEWFDTEAEDLYKISQHSKDEIPKWVWTSGLLMDRSKVFDNIADLYLALIIAEHFGLARRVEQIEKMIEEFGK